MRATTNNTRQDRPRKEAPHFVGAHFERSPYLSGIGTLLRLSRLNQYQAQDYRFAFSLHVRRHDDLNALMTFSAKRKDQLAKVLSVPPEMRAAWDLAPWLPLTANDESLQEEWRFRFCPACLQCGYHTLLQQLPWIERCPWHGLRLRNGCTKCGKPILLSGASGNWLGTCVCGYDHFDRRKALPGLPSPDAADTFLGRYLCWARGERNEVCLLPPVPASTVFSCLTPAIGLPPSLRYRVQSGSPHTTSHVERIGPQHPHRRQDCEDEASAFAKLEALREPRATVIETPGPLSRRVAQVAYRLATQMPPGSLSDAEMTLFLEPLGVEANQGFVPARRRSLMDIGTLPLRTIGRRTYLDLHCVSPVTRQAAFRLLEAMTKDEEPWRSMSPVQLWSAVEAASIVLARGYSEGIRIVMGRHVPELYGLKRDRPHLSEPWILVRKRPATVVVVWARLKWIPD